MARAIHQLTPERAKNKSNKPGLHRDGGGLFLSVKPPKAASWVFRYMLEGRAREMGMGSFPEVSLPEAREKADDARKLKAAGIDPIEARKDVEAARKLQAATAMTFRQCAQAYIDAHRDGWKNAKHAKQWDATLGTYVYPHFGNLPVGSIDVGLVTKVLEPIWKTKTETASRVRGRIEAVLDWAKARGYRQADNPARWRGHLENLLPARSTVQTVEHHPALPYSDMPAFWVGLKQQDGIASQALRFTILTAARTDQTIKAQWAEIDFGNAVWIIPGGRMKGRRGKEREHRVPLSKPALAVLNEQRKATGGEGYIFPGQKPKKPLSNMAMANVLARMKRDDITVHGFRSTFRDWTEETTNFAGSVAEAALAHVVGDKVEAAYRRGDLFEKRRKLMDAWARFATTPAQESGKVISINKRGTAT